MIDFCYKCKKLKFLCSCEDDYPFSTSKLLGVVPKKIQLSNSDLLGAEYFDDIGINRGVYDFLGRKIGEIDNGPIQRVLDNSRSNTGFVFNGLGIVKDPNSPF